MPAENLWVRVRLRDNRQTNSSVEEEGEVGEKGEGRCEGGLCEEETPESVVEVDSVVVEAGLPERLMMEGLVLW